MTTVRLARTYLLDNHAFPNNTQIPTPIKVVPLIHFMIVGLRNTPRYLPANTPNVPAMVIATKTPSKTDRVDLLPADAASAANCDLSPISTRSIIVNVEMNTCQSKLSPNHSVAFGVVEYAIFVFHLNSCVFIVRKCVLINLLKAHFISQRFKFLI